MKVSRQEALRLVKRGIPVVATGGGNPPREVRKADELPAEPAEAYDGPPLEFNRLRDDRGNLTRAGMLHAINQGGSVRHGGDTLTRADQVPDDDEIQEAADAAVQTELHRLDAEQANLDQRRARATQRQQRQGERLADDMGQTGESRLVAAEPQTGGTQTAEGQTAEPAAPPTGEHKEHRAAAHGRHKKE
jgi:hypothetical protein